MDFSKIFIKDARPTKVGGQAVLEGIMMKGADRTAVAVRLPDDSMYIKTKKLKPRSKWYKVPIIRGCLIFINSLVTGVGTLMDSAELLEKYDPQYHVEEEEETRFTKWLKKRFGENAPMTFALVMSVVIALVFTIGIFIIGPTWVVNVFNRWISNEIILNLIEGVFRIVLFVLYVVLISKMKDIKTVFQFHGAEHQCIHCFEGNKELTPENCSTYETLHPRCGTSFLMFVMVISLLLFSLLGWPNLLIRILSRLLLIPIIAGLSYELLKWAGSSTSLPVKILSVPGLLLQKLTTRIPEKDQLEVAIASMKAVLVSEDAPEIEGFCDKNGELLPEVPEEESALVGDDTTAEKTIEVEIFSVDQETGESIKDNPMFVSPNEILEDLEKKYGKEFVEDLTVK